MEENNDLEKMLEERYAELPEQVRLAIDNSNWQEKIRNIVQKNNLLVDQGAQVEDETLMVMFGFESPSDFLGNLITNGHLSPTVAEQISSEVGKEIFEPIKNSLVAFTEKKSEKEGDTQFDKITPTEVESTKKDLPKNTILTSNLEDAKVEKPTRIDPYRESFS